MTGPYRLGAFFHEVAGSELERLSFRLVNDPSKYTGRFQVTEAKYKTPEAFHLWFRFDPLDGAYAVIRCGRIWLVDEQFSVLSNDYYRLARRFGFELEPYYQAHDRAQWNDVMAMMLKDVLATAPTILERVTTEDLEAIEEMAMGATSRIAAYSDGSHNATVMPFTRK